MGHRKPSITLVLRGEDLPTRSSPSSSMGAYIHVSSATEGGGGAAPSRVKHFPISLRGSVSSHFWGAAGCSVYTVLDAQPSLSTSILLTFPCLPRHRIFLGDPMLPLPQSLSFLSRPPIITHSFVRLQSLDRQVLFKCSAALSLWRNRPWRTWVDVCPSLVTFCHCRSTPEIPSISTRLQGFRRQQNSTLNLIEPWTLLSNNATRLRCEEPAPSSYGFYTPFLPTRLQPAFASTS